ARPAVASEPFASALSESVSVEVAAPFGVADPSPEADQTDPEADPTSQIGTAVAVQAPEPSAAERAVRTIAEGVADGTLPTADRPFRLAQQGWFWGAVVAVALGVFLTVLIDLTTDDPSPSMVTMTLGP
ncbi:MAG: hypothetical protein ACFCGT_26455, partial [Sandaracinaceae bacterium]